MHRGELIMLLLYGLDKEENMIKTISLTANEEKEVELTGGCEVYMTVHIQSGSIHGLAKSMV